MQRRSLIATAAAMPALAALPARAQTRPQMIAAEQYFFIFLETGKLFGETPAVAA